MSKWGRRTNYCGTSMRSRLEAGFAAHLDRENDRRSDQFAWRYEPGAFADRTGQYLPDFRLELAGSTAYVEVKPNNAEALGAHQRMQIILASEPAAELWTATPIGLDVADYRPEACAWRVDRVLTRRAPDLAASLSRGGLTWARKGDWLTTNEGTRTAILDAAATGGPWRYEPGQRVQATWAVLAAAYKQAHPDTWVLAAAHGADASYVPLVELDADQVVTDLYPSGHSFTHNDLDRLLGALGAR